jgi:hypothetical protein
MDELEGWPSHMRRASQASRAQAHQERTLKPELDVSRPSRKQAIRRLAMQLGLSLAACEPSHDLPAPEAVPVPEERTSVESSQGEETQLPAATCADPCGPEGWSEAVLLDTKSTGNARFPSVAMDEDGNAIAVWYEEVGQRGSVLASRYDAQTERWSDPVLLEKSNRDARVPSIAMTRTGSAAVVWMQKHGRWYRIHVSHYDAQADTWGRPMSVDIDERGDSYEPDVAADANGNLIVAWEHDSGRVYSIYANRYDAQRGTWGTAALLEKDDTGNARLPSVAVDDHGNAVAAWSQDDGGPYSIYANHFDARRGRWNKAVVLDADDAGGAWVPQVAVSGHGHAHVVWDQLDGNRRSIQINHFDPLVGRWGEALLFEPEDRRTAVGSHVAVDGMGNALTVWQQHDDTWMSINASRYDSRTRRWGQAVRLETANEGSAFSPKAAMDRNGNAVVVWEQHAGKRVDIYANRYQASDDRWGVATLLEADAGDASGSQVAMAADGSAVAVWYQHDGTRIRIRASHLD